MSNPTKSVSRAFWPLVIGLLIVVGFLVMYVEYSDGKDSSIDQQVAPSTEWTSAPRGGVEVDLPETAIATGEPESDAGGQRSDADDKP